MQRGESHQPAVWLVAGTGEGPPLAAALLARGWWVQVSVVSPDALRAYVPHPRLALRVGALAGEPAITDELERAVHQGRPFRWVVDASHPFAVQISAALASSCRRLGQPLLRLRRPAAPPQPGERLELLAGAEALERLALGNERLLLAIGARHLSELSARSGAGVCFARVLPTPQALRQARAAGLRDEHLACHRPGSGPGIAGFALERALLRHWRITAVLCRQSGGSTELGWRSLCREAGLRLLLLARPAEPEGVMGLPAGPLLEKLGPADASP